MISRSERKINCFIEEENERDRVREKDEKREGEKKETDQERDKARDCKLTDNCLKETNDLLIA